MRQDVASRLRQLEGKQIVSGMRVGSAYGPCRAPARARRLPPRRRRRRFLANAVGARRRERPLGSGISTGHAFVVARFPLRRLRDLRGREQRGRPRGSRRRPRSCPDKEPQSVSARRRLRRRAAARRLFDGVAARTGKQPTRLYARLPGRGARRVAAAAGRDAGRAARRARAAGRGAASRIRDRLDRLGGVAARRVGFGAARMTNVASPSWGGEAMTVAERRSSGASPPPSARHGGFSNDRGHRGRRGYDRYADPSPDPASCRRAGKRRWRRASVASSAATRRLCRNFETASGGSAAEDWRFRERPRRADAPLRARPTSSGGGDVRGPLAGEKSPGGKKSLFESGLAMPAVSMPSFGAPMAAMHKAAEHHPERVEARKKKSVSVTSKKMPYRT